MRSIYMAIGAILISGPLFISCKTSTGQSATQSIIGTDDRVPSTQLPKLKELFDNAVGAIFVSGKVCTGFYMDKKVWTAASCVDGSGDKQAIFKVPSGSSFPLVLPNAVDINAGIIALEFNGADRPKATLSLGGDDGQNTMLAGYSEADAKIMFSFNCALTKSELSTGYVHKCDTVKGNAGAPILNNSNEVIAMHIGYDPNAKLNFALKLAELSPLSADDLHIIDAEFSAGTNFACCRAVSKSCADGSMVTQYELALVDRAMTEADAGAKCWANGVHWGAVVCPSSTSCSADSGGSGTVDPKYIDRYKWVFEMGREEKNDRYNPGGNWTHHAFKEGVDYTSPLVEQSRDSNFVYLYNYANHGWYALSKDQQLTRVGDTGEWNFNRKGHWAP